MPRTISRLNTPLSAGGFSIARLSPYIALLLSLCAASCAPAPPRLAARIGDAVRIETPDGPRFISIVAPSGPPKSVAVMFPGGDGRIGIGADGAIARQGNFLIRTGPRWVERGAMFVAVDAAPNRVGLPGDRVGPENLRAIDAIVAALRRRTEAPIWLLGTSAGAPAALAGAASLPKGTIRGAVVSSPVSTPGPRDSVFDVPLARVTVPILIQVHRDDVCRITPPGNALALKAALTGARAVDIQTFEGGDPPRSSACEAFSPHGFLGLETRVVGAAIDWMHAH